MKDAKYFDLPELISVDIINRASKLSPAQLCDGMKTLGIINDGCLDADIMPVDENKVMIGTACTVNTEGGDNLPIHVAIYQGKPGYVMMVDGKGCKERAYLGDLIGAAAEAVGFEGIVVDGFIRDRIGLKELNISIFSKGFMQRGPSKKGPGEINTKIACGGVVVEPGDLVLGDCDGVTVVPREKMEAVIALAEKKAEYEVNRRKTINKYMKCKEEGKDLPDISPQWVNEMKKNMGI